MKERIISKLKEFTAKDGVAFMSSTEAEQYYKGLVEIIEGIVIESIENILPKNALYTFVRGR